MVIFLGGTVMAIFSPSYEVFLLASFVQGMGTGCGGAMCRTVTRDCYNGTDLHRANSLVSMGIIFSPLLAPVLGGYLSSYFDWTASYYFLLLFGALVTVAMMMFFTETLPPQNRRQEKVWVSYRYVVSNRQFQGYVLCLIATFAGIAVFEAAAGVLLGSVLKLEPTMVSFLFVLPLPGYLGGSWLSANLVKKMGNTRVLYLGMSAIVLGAVTILVPGLAGTVTVSSLIGGAFLYFIGAGVLFPAATTAAIEPFPNHAGTAGAVLGGLQNLGAGLATLAASMMPADNQLSLGIVMIVMSFIVMVSLSWVRKGQQHDTELLV